MKRILILLGCATLLTGCNVYKQFERPDVETDSLYGQDVRVADTTSIASLPWTELFTDTELQALINEGLANNTDLGIARLRVEEAKATLFSSRLAYLPSLSINPQGQLSRQVTSRQADEGNPLVNSSTRSSSATYNIAATAEWEVDIFGRLTNAKRGAKAALEQSLAYQQAVRTQLIATIANSYYNLLTLDRQLDISRRTALSWDEIVRTYDAKLRVGEATAAAVAQAKASKLAVEGQVLTLEKQIRAQENSLSALLGRVPGAIRRTTLDSQRFPEHLAVGVPLQLLDRRPDVRQAEAALAQAFYNTNAARAAFYPSITLSGQAGWTNTNGAVIMNPGSWLLNAIGSITQPLFNRGRNIANLRIAKARQDEAMLSFRQSLLKAGNEVNDALTQWQTANRRLDIDREQVEALRTAVDNTTQLMQYSNQASYLEVLTARQSLLQAELTEVNDRFDMIQGVISLYHSLGGGGEW